MEVPTERTISISGELTESDLGAVRDYLGNLGLRTEIVPMDFPRADLPALEAFELDEDSEFLDKEIIDGEEKAVMSVGSFTRFLESVALRGIRRPDYSANKVFINLANFRADRYSRKP